MKSGTQPGGERKKEGICFPNLGGTTVGLARVRSFSIVFKMFNRLGLVLSGYPGGSDLNSNPYLNRLFIVVQFVEVREGIQS